MSSDSPSPFMGRGDRRQAVGGAAAGQAPSITSCSPSFANAVAEKKLANAIREEALALGFSAARFAALPDVWGAADRLTAFIDAGFHGDMQWMEETHERRRHPRNMWSDAKGALVLAYNYGPDSDPREGLARPEAANLSVYARGDDYHELIKKKLKTLATWIVGQTGCELKVFVDTAPLMEKPLAQLAGLGWQGKHTNLVSRELGSWFFLGVILFDRVLGDDGAERDHCGSCSACLTACPTDAFVGPYQLDARKCLSYLTIELRGPWPERFRHQMGNRIYGCDDCLAACPWNKFAQASQDMKLQAREGFTGLKLTELTKLSDAEFRALFSKSAIKRIGRESFLRNVNYALGNAGKASQDPEIEAALLQILADDSAVVRGSAVWGLKQVLSEDAFAELRDRYVVSEGDEAVRAEWAGDYAR
ncbi:MULTISPECIES: tRNA epoxyqueuosine(34) reductase QueG [Asticcacaulis]|uniref:tRNA epoxyqueuosine(34) reductase QueG n=1 Tax=Asticcacaulis TaxID=76890 RepID=UPI001FDA91F9|nr:MULTISPECIES: tRNA epoxyqueuosine(34) reductase QueG [Asticcacaulis]MBP2160035.1 epoxyqueuosine reductase [Asticcacaulis solisilvae]MDR6801080.1 epoxyqueuosine reductase [Asticcacaulis sp. BE141]